MQTSTPGYMRALSETDMSVPGVGQSVTRAFGSCGRARTPDGKEDVAFLESSKIKPVRSWFSRNFGFKFHRAPFHEEDPTSFAVDQIARHAKKMIGWIRIREGEKFTGQS
jgi:hypothetical protein